MSDGAFLEKMAELLETLEGNQVPGSRENLEAGGAYHIAVSKCIPEILAVVEEVKSWNCDNPECSICKVIEALDKKAEGL